MRLIRPDSVISVLDEISATLLGRVLAFFFTYVAAFGFVVVITSNVWVLGGDSCRMLNIHLSEPRVLLAVCFFLPAMGIFTGWGLMSYAVILGLLVSYVWFERPATRILPPLFFLQSFEVARCQCMWDGWSSLGNVDTILIAAVWAIGLMVYLVFLFTQPRSLLGS